MPAGDSGSIPGREGPLKRMAAHASASCLEKPAGQRSLAGCSPCGHKSDVTDHVHTSSGDKETRTCYLPGPRAQLAATPAHVSWWRPRHVSCCECLWSPHAT